MIIILPVLFLFQRGNTLDFRSKLTPVLDQRAFKPEDLPLQDKYLNFNPYAQLDNNDSSRYQYGEDIQAATFPPVSAYSDAQKLTKLTSSIISAKNKIENQNNETFLYLASVTSTSPPNTTSETLPITRQPVVINRYNSQIMKLSNLSHSVGLSASQSKFSAISNKKRVSNLFSPSHRLVNDILVIPSARRFYILVIMPIHESAGYQGFECGQVDLNGFVRLAALIDAIESVNKGRTLQDAGLSIGAIVVDSCSSDLHTVADLYELLFSTNIEKFELIALVRDDSSYLPNVDDFVRYLRIPTINTFFTPNEQPMSTGMLPAEEPLIEAILSLIKYTHSTCVSILFDDNHANTAKLLAIHAEKRYLCIDGQIRITGHSSVDVAQTAIRKLLLTHARFVIVFVDDKAWLDFLQALRNEMVIAGRFVIVIPQSERWTTSLQFADAWPHFDQLLLSITNRRLNNPLFINHLTQRFPHLPFPQHWLKQFWMTAFKCHIDGEHVFGKKFSRPCSSRQALNLTSIAPDLNLEPIVLAVNSIAASLRQLIDSVCPGALLQTLSDCVNDPFSSLYQSIKSTRFNHFINTEPDVYINASTGFRDAEIIVNRVRLSPQEMQFEEVANWDAQRGLRYVARNDLFLEERDGSRQRVHSSCPKSPCAMRFAYQKQAGKFPTFRSGLNDISTLIFAGFAILWMFVCLMCVYQHLISRADETYRVCTMITFVGLAFLSFVAIFFIMVPSSITCTIRTTCLSIALSFIFSPILVKSVIIWRREIILTDLHSPHSSSTNSSTLFWLSALGIAFQLIIVAEWMFFESPTNLVFVNFSEHSTWRCAPGQKYEQRLFHSLILTVFMIVITLVISLITAKNMDSRQNILVSITSILFGTTLYLLLPLVRYSIRDKIFSSALLLFSMLVMVISYCRSAFITSDISLLNTSSIEKGPERFIEAECHLIHDPEYRITHGVTLRHHHSMSRLPISEGRHVTMTQYTVPRKDQMPFRTSSLSLVE